MANIKPGVLRELLSIATEAQGNRPVDENLQKLSVEDREFIEKALQQTCANLNDPVKQLRNALAELESIEQNVLQRNPPTDESTRATSVDRVTELIIINVFKELSDLCCDIDLALDFCSLGGLPILQRYLDMEVEPVAVGLFHLIATLAQHHEEVQLRMVNGDGDLDHGSQQQYTFLTTSLDVVAGAGEDVEGQSQSGKKYSTVYKLKCLYGISAIVKHSLPALHVFLQNNGPDKLLRCFEFALKRFEEEEKCPGAAAGEAGENYLKLLHRCVVTAKNIRDSFPAQVLNLDKATHKLDRLPGVFECILAERKKKSDSSGADDRNLTRHFDESLDYLQN